MGVAGSSPLSSASWPTGGAPASILSDSYAAAPSGHAPPPTSASHTRGPCVAAHATQTSRPPVSPPPVTRRTVVSPSVAVRFDHAGTGGRTPVSRSIVAGGPGPRGLPRGGSSDAAGDDALSGERKWCGGGGEFGGDPPRT